MSEDAIRPLIDRARAGDAAAFEELFRPWQPDVARVCRRLLGSSDAAEDATHEVFLRARSGFASFEPGRPFRPWLLGIAGHLCLDRLRRRRTEARIFDARDLDGDDFADPGPSPLRQVVREEERREILTAIDALPIKYRLPLVLRYFNDLDYDAIADVLGVTRSQVGTLLFRGRRRLRERLAAGSAAIVSLADRRDAGEKP